MAPLGQPASGSLRLTYDTPEGWAPGEVNRMRKAAFVVQDGERKVEITAIDLDASAGALLPNVNRWRQQVQLDEITQAELEETVSPIELGGEGGHYVEIVGPEEADSRQAILGAVVVQGGKAWFFKLWGDAELALQEKERFREFVASVQFAAPNHGGSLATSASRGGGDSSLAYDVPEGWVPGKVGGARKASFLVQDGERSVEITAIDLDVEAGALLPNVNRWRRKMQMDEITEAELDKTVSPIQVGGVDGHYVELVGPEDAEQRRGILGVVAIRDGRAWFFHLAGDAELALREKERFLGFVRSVRFGAAVRVENGD